MSEMIESKIWETLKEGFDESNIDMIALMPNNRVMVVFRVESVRVEHKVFHFWKSVNGYRCISGSLVSVSFSLSEIVGNDEELSGDE